MRRGAAPLAVLIVGVLGDSRKLCRLTARSLYRGLRNVTG